MKKTCRTWRARAYCGRQARKTAGWAD